MYYYIVITVYENQDHIFSFDIKKEKKEKKKRYLPLLLFPLHFC